MTESFFIQEFKKLVEANVHFIFNDEIRTRPTIRNHNKSTIKQKLWLYDYERDICIFLKKIFDRLHCAVIATHLSKRARKKPTGLVS